MSGEEKIKIVSNGKDLGTTVWFYLNINERGNINSPQRLDKFPSIIFLEESSPKAEILTKRSVNS